MELGSEAYWGVGWSKGIGPTPLKGQRLRHWSTPLKGLRLRHWSISLKGQIDVALVRPSQRTDLCGTACIKTYLA